MDNLIRSSEEFKKEREMWVAVSTLIAVVIILISLAIKYREYFMLWIFSIPYIISIFFGLFFFYLKYYNRKLGNTVISERETHGSRGGGYKVHKTRLMNVILYIYIAGCVLLIPYTIVVAVFGFLWIFSRDSAEVEVAPN